MDYHIHKSAGILNLGSWNGLQATNNLCLEGYQLESRKDAKPREHTDIEEYELEKNNDCN